LFPSSAPCLRNTTALDDTQRAMLQYFGNITTRRHAHGACGLLLAAGAGEPDVQVGGRRNGMETNLVMRPQQRQE